MADRRAYGEGGCSQRKDGRWEATLRLPNGSRRSFYGATQREALRRLGQAKATIQRGAPLPPERLTLAAFLDRWLAEVKAGTVEPKTLRGYMTDVDDHIVPHLGQRKLREITTSDVQRWVNTLATTGATEKKTTNGRRGLGPAGIQHARATLRNALERAIADGYLVVNPAKRLDLPRSAKRRIPALTATQAAAILAAFAGHPLDALITLTLCTGLRQGELLGLAWTDVDLDAGTLYSHQQVQRTSDGAYALKDTKTHQARTLALPQIALDALRAHRARQQTARAAAGATWTETGRIFTTRTGGYLNGSWVTHTFAKRLTAAGLPHLTFHQLRHGNASLLLAGGASMREVMEQLGHSQIGITMNTYAHVAAAALRDNAARLDAQLSPGAAGERPSTHPSAARGRWAPERQNHAS